MEKEKHLEKLFELLRIKSISALSEHKTDIKKACEFIKNDLIEIGFNKSKIEFLTDGRADSNPVIYAERIDNPENPTILIYGHYDVQPVDPIDEWKTDPFEPEVINGNIYARGATDDKGQMYTHIAALKDLSEEWGEVWPVNVKLAIEGEEEMGGETIEHLINENPEKYSANVCIVSDTGFLAPDKPTIEYGLKGLAYMQINVKLSDNDLHSGIYGGAVMNPANALVHIISKLYDQETGKVLIPGFYDDVVEISSEEREKLSQIPFNKETFLKEAGNAKDTFSEEGYTAIEHSSARPTLDINGFTSGFGGEGAKTIIPATASAKVSMRLVANQDPKKIANLFREFVTSIAPTQVDVEILEIHGGNGVLVDLNSKYIKIAEEALEEVFGNRVVFSRSGGSIPIVADLYNKVGVDVILIGYGLADDNLHAPNEKFNVDQFYKGIECNKTFIKKLIK